MRGLPAPGRTTAESPAEPWSAKDRQKLLGQYQQSLSLKEKALGRDHPSVHFLKFEVGRMQLEAGQAQDGRKRMSAAVQALLPKLGRDHPDLEAMRAWLSGSKAASSF